jgi:hypothetical protein
MPDSNERDTEPIRGCIIFLDSFCANAILEVNVDRIKNKIRFERMNFILLEEFIIAANGRVKYYFSDVYFSYSLNSIQA